MTHKAAEGWNANITMRAWHNPEFDPDCGSKEHNKQLAGNFRLLNAVFDDPEVDDLINILPEARYNFLQNQQQAYSDWRNMRLPERREICNQLYKEIHENGISTFDDFDALMRLDLKTLRPFHVDYKKFPYGQDNPQASKPGIYQSQHGKCYYVGLKPWLFETGETTPIFLTTENVVAEIIKKAYGPPSEERNKSRLPPLLSLDLDDLPGIFHIKVPTFIDKRAKSDRIQEEELNVSAIAREILDADQNAVVITDGVKDTDNVYTFQGMKGLNGLEDRNIYIILTWMAPAKYAELNVLGQWLGNENILFDYYQDQINQAVGRNRGFRDSEQDTKTVIVTSRGLWTRFLGKLENGFPRTQLYSIQESPWCSPGTT